MHTINYFASLGIFVSGMRHAEVKNTNNKMILIYVDTVLCNVVQKRCSYVVVHSVQCGAGPVKSKIKEKSIENLWIIV